MRFLPRRSAWAPIAILCLAAPVTGCAASGRFQMATPPGSLRGYHVMLVVASATDTDARKEAFQLEATTSAVGRKLLGDHELRTGRTHRGEPVDLRIEATIVQLTRVNRQSRVRRGPLAGRASVIANVTLTDAGTGAIVGRFSVEGRSSARGTTEQAIRRAAEQIVTVLR